MELEGWFMEEFAPDWTMVVVLLGYIMEYVCMYVVACGCRVMIALMVLSVLNGNHSVIPVRKAWNTRSI